MSKPKMKPIIFSTPMVRALLDGRKTQTRRVIKLPEGHTGHPIGEAGNENNPLGLWWMCGIKRPAYLPGDTMWVKETWQHVDNGDEHSGYVYRASENGKAWEENAESWKWRPSIFMPREAARIFLRVMDVRVERLHDITEEDAAAEGADYFHPKFYQTKIKIWSTTTYRAQYCALWDCLNAKRGYSWDKNPWCWVYAFERITECCRCGQIEDCNDGLCEQCEFELMLELMQEEEPYE